MGLQVTVANAHAVFNGLRTAPSYLAAITVEEHRRKALLAARKEIRSVLRAAFASLTVQDEYWESDYRNTVQRERRKPIIVKFSMQGSFAYGTLNSPALQGQEIDLDDGMYLPVDFLNNGRPALVAKSLFNFVEMALQPLCQKMGWRTAKKPTCVRVLTGYGAHIDLPIYSIPRAQFETLIEKAVVADSADFRVSAASARTTLPTDQIMLAMRDGDWVQSDPQKLRDWVDECVDVYGEVFRRLCRFFKGWRDFTWLKSDLSSICLMRAIDMVLEQTGLEPVETRDDEMIMAVAKHLPVIFAQKICNPTLPEDCDEACLNAWTPEARTQIVLEANKLAVAMDAALEKSVTGDAVLARLIERFGQRVPNAPEAIKFGHRSIEVIKSSQPDKVAAPVVTSTISG